jgi:hypothetical protein
VSAIAWERTILILPRTEAAVEDQPHGPRKADPNGDFQKVTLKQGGFVVDATVLDPVRG